MAICTGSRVKGSWQHVNGAYGQTFVPETTTYSNGEPVYATEYTYDFKPENLELSIKNSSTGFYYNDSRSKEQIAEDLFNAYKHVRYLAHYKNPGIIDKIKNWREEL